MRCWKCGQELADGVGSCVYCGAIQSRPEPVTEVGRALRGLYDRYGAKTVLTNSAYLVSGLGDLVEDAKKLRNQLKMALDAGVGRVYLEQLEQGAPDGGFDRRVKLLLTEDAGLSNKAAGEITSYFDEMIGWRRSAQHARAQGSGQGVGGRVPGTNEIDRTGRYASPQWQTSRAGRGETSQGSAADKITFRRMADHRFEVLICQVRGSTGTITEVTYVAQYFKGRYRPEQLNALEAHAKSLPHKRVSLIRSNQESDHFQYQHQLRTGDIARADADGVMHFVCLDSSNVPRVFELPFTRDADALSRRLAEEGFQAGS